MTFDQAQAIIRARLQNREANFLKVLKRGVFDYPKSPYLKLFEIAKISYGDVEKLVKQHGLERSLEILRDEGVYFSVEEFKGKMSVKRNGIEFKVCSQDFYMPRRPKNKNFELSFEAELPGAITGFGLGYLYNIASVYCVCDLEVLENYFSESVFPVLICHRFPANPGLGVILSFIKAGKSLLKWFYFTRLNLKQDLLAKKGMSLILLMIRIFGNKIQLAKLSDRDKANEILNFIKSNVNDKLLIATESTFILNLCDLAQKNKIKLDNVSFHWSGEPFTERKKEKIHKQGAKVIATYAFREMGHVARACLESKEKIDDYHLFADTVALIQRKREIAPGCEINVFLWTGLSMDMPNVLINLENGDYGIIEKKPCDCLLTNLGFDMHISKIHSFERFMSEELGFLSFCCEEIVQSYLPERFGGESYDYQFVQETKIDSTDTRIYLYISPSLGGIDEKLVYLELDKLFKQRKDTRNIVFSFSHNGNIVQIKRLKPLQTYSGPILKIRPFLVKTIA